MQRFFIATLGVAVLMPALALLMPRAHAADAAPRAPDKTLVVQIKGFAFVPATLTIAPGTTVTWTNADEDPHSVVANDKSFRSAALDTDDHYSFTFAKPGDYGYFCSLHPHMTGRIIVKAG